MTASYENIQRFPVPLAALGAAVDGALRDLGSHDLAWSPDGRSVAASIGMNFWSWGERMEIWLSDFGDVRVRSTCSWPLQLFDWGKNSQNCRDLLDAVARRLIAEGRLSPPALPPPA